MAGSAIAVTSRRRPVPTGDEEATTTLKLGEMRHASAISTAAAHQILVSIEEDRIKRNENPLVKNDLTNKTTQYLETFARFKGTETVTAVNAEVEQLRELAEFEKAQLGMSGTGWEYRWDWGLADRMCV